MFDSITCAPLVGRQLPDDFFDLTEDVVHVLCLNTTEHSNWLEAGMAVLDQVEQQRAARYLNPLHGRRYAYTRGLLRILLGRFLKRTPSDIEFNYGAYGKPGLNSAEELNFNLSHSGEWVAYGFSMGRQIGIDLESVADCRESLLIARQYFSTRELAVVEQGINTAQAFCNIWVRKEAVVKAAGLGLDRLREFCTLDPVVALPDGRGAPLQWRLTEIPAPTGHAMALAAEGSPVRNVIFRL